MLRRRVPTAALLALWFASAAHAREHRFSAAAGGELNLQPSLGGHGFAVLTYDLSGKLPRDGHFTLYFNSDTLRVAFERLRFDGGRLEAGVNATGEVLIAGLLPDYWRDGRTIAARGFYASYVAAGGYVKILATPHYLEFATTLRQWFFTRQGVTSPSLTLPPDAFVGELRARYTLWSVDSDPSLYQPHRLFPRVRGFAFGVEVGLDLRSEARPWGARDPTVFTPPDLRNDPGRAIFGVKQWLRAGWQAHPRLRLEIAEQASFFWGEDDLVRQRVGGMNPWVVPLAGAPWAGLLVGNLAAVEASLHARVWRELEVGALLDALVVDDLERTGDPTKPGGLVGVGAFGDFRFGAWQADLRAGWTPSLQAGHAFSVLAVVGVGWSRPKK